MFSELRILLHTGLRKGLGVAEQVALGAKYPVVLLLLTAFSVLVSKVGSQ